MIFENALRLFSKQKYLAHLSSKYCRTILTYIIITLLASPILLFKIDITNSTPDDYTHNVLNEQIVSIYCGVCNKEEPKILEIYREYKGAYIPVAYHIQDEWENDDSKKAIGKYRVTVTPTHIFDGGYKKMAGLAISRNMVDQSGPRPVHRIALAVKKTVVNGVINYYGSVQELDGQSFEGIIRVFIVENELRSQESPAVPTVWQFVFRDFGIEQTVTLQPHSHSLFSGSYEPAPEYNIENILVVASIWEETEEGKFYSIQAINDEYSSEPLIKSTQINTEVPSETVVTTTDSKRDTTQRTLTETLKTPVETKKTMITTTQVNEKISYQPYLYTIIALLAIVIILLGYRRFKK